MPPTLHHEKALWHQGLHIIAGVDEVGRGSLAGPIVAAAVVWSPGRKHLREVNDSKLLSAQTRTLLAEKIQTQAAAWGIGVGSVELINNHGIVAAQQYAMVEAIQQIETKLTDCHHLLIDGLPFKNPLPLQTDTSFIVKGDQKVFSIAAASIMAKVYRDQLMINLATEFPHFNWEQNVGYGTNHHRTQIKLHGLTPHHRRLFCRKALGYT